MQVLFKEILIRLARLLGLNVSVPTFLSSLINFILRYKLRLFASSTPSLRVDLILSYLMSYTNDACKNAVSFDMMFISPC